MRRAIDRLYVRSLGPREREAAEWITEHPGATVEQLQAAMGVGRKRVWQYVARLELARVRRAGEPPMRRSPRGRSGGRAAAEK